MIEMVAGFAFRDDQVLLITKNRPAWQCGWINGPGGKVEPGEDPNDAMRREMLEETGIDDVQWSMFAQITDRVSATISFFCGDTYQLGYQRTDEEIHWHAHNQLPNNVLPNLPLLILLARYSDNLIEPVCMVARTLPPRLPKLGE